MTAPASEPAAEPGPFAFIYSPADGEMQQWEFDPSAWTVGEMSTVERMYRKPRDEFLADVNDGYVTARKILLWIVRRPTEPELTMDDIDELNSGDLGLFQLVRDDTGPGADDEDQTEVDPEPDAVNDPKAGRPGESGNESGTVSPPSDKSAG